MCINKEGQITEGEVIRFLGKEKRLQVKVNFMLKCLEMY